MRPGSLRRAVFLDRDGVLIRAVVREGKPHPPDEGAPHEIADGAAQACEELRRAGFLLVMVTNQPDVARGLVNLASVHRRNAELRRELRLDDVKICPHDDADGCRCRKPNPGMLLRAATEHGIDLGASYMVGDRWRDIEAGRRAGCRTVLIDYGYDEQRPHMPDRTAGSLAEAVAWILAERGRVGDEFSKDRATEGKKI